MKSNLIGRSARGFSLVEIMIVIAIIGILLVFVGPRIIRTFSNSSITKESTNVRDLMTAGNAYRESGGLGPSGTNAVPLLIQNGDLPSSWRVTGGIPMSAWNSDVKVTISGIGLSIEYTGVPAKDCIKFATKTSAEDFQTTVNGTAMQGTMPATVAASACTATANSVSFTQIR
ncbi:type 4 pilus major pilin [Xanthomonas citri]|uniref:type 4 pilus major pilin n=1 Tax=Xanthomonas citri TaxID=346 RepID=UPI000C635F6D|nr:type 4 pilus major pilin [Xanthomonas citri]SOO14149.1 putative Type IV B pilus protein [Xanthomonas citri pv. fuscans]